MEAPVSSDRTTLVAFAFTVLTGAAAHALFESTDAGPLPAWGLAAILAFGAAHVAIGALLSPGVAFSLVLVPVAATFWGAVDCELEGQWLCENSSSFSPSPSSSWALSS